MKYWTEEQEDLVIEFINESDNDKRSTIYLKLRPAILDLVKGVHQKYYSSLDEMDELLSQCESHVVLNVLPKFRAGKQTKAFSFIGTSVKNLLNNIYASKVKQREHLSIHTTNEHGDLIFDFPDDTIDKEDLTEGLRLEASKKLESVRKSFRFTKGSRRVFDALEKLIAQNRISKHYATYFLLRETRLKNTMISAHLRKMGFRRLVHVECDLKCYERLLGKNRCEDEIKDILSSMNEEKVYKYPIQDKAATAKKRRETKARNRMNNAKMFINAFEDFLEDC